MRVEVGTGACCVLRSRHVVCDEVGTGECCVMRSIQVHDVR